MSYGANPQQTSRSPGLNPLLLIVVCVAVFWFLNGNRRPSGPADQGSGPPRPAQNQLPPEPAGGNGNWEMEELEAVQSDQPSIPDSDSANGRKFNPSNSSKDGWSMEELDVKQGNETKSPGSDIKTKKTEKGDWAIEEIEGKK